MVESRFASTNTNAVPNVFKKEIEIEEKKCKGKMKKKTTLFQLMNKSIKKKEQRKNGEESIRSPFQVR